MIDDFKTSIYKIDNDFKIVFASESLSIFLGISIEDIIGKRCYSLLNQNISPCKFCPIVSNRLELKYYYELISDNGNYGYFVSNITKSEDKYLVSMLDMTEMRAYNRDHTHQIKEQQAEISRLKNELYTNKRKLSFFERSLDYSQAGAMFIDRDYNIIHMNLKLRALVSDRIDRENFKCYSIYEYDSPCSFCPWTNVSKERQAKTIKDRSFVVEFSRMEHYMLEILRDVTKDLSYLKSTKESQEKLIDKQSQMEILNIDLIKTNDKLKIIQNAMDDELKRVGYIQSSLLPKNSPVIDGYDFGVVFISTKYASGDYYDFIDASEGNLGIVLADVSGHGTPAAVIMAMTRAIMRSYTLGVTSSSDVLSMVNEVLCDNIYTKDFVTMFYLVLNIEKDSINYSSAGHHPVLFYDASEFMVKKLSVGGLLLGIFKEQEYEEKVLTLDTGDILFLYTDGLIEVINKDNEQYGYDRLLSKIIMYSSLRPQDMIDEIMKDVKDFTNSESYRDDITVVAIKKG